VKADKRLKELLMMQQLINLTIGACCIDGSLFVAEAFLLLPNIFS